MLLKVLDDDGNITDVEATKKEVHDNSGKRGMIANHVGINQSITLLQKAVEEIGYEINPNDIRYLTMLKRNEDCEQRFTYFYYIKTNITNEDLKLNTYLVTDKKWFDFYELQELMLIDSEEVVFKNTPAYINIFGELFKIIKGVNTNKEYCQKEFIILNTEDGCFLPGLIQHSDKKTKSIIMKKCFKNLITMDTTL